MIKLNKKIDCKMVRKFEELTNRRLTVNGVDIDSKCLEDTLQKVEISIIVEELFNFSKAPTLGRLLHKRPLD